ncbi:MAG TPA: zf-TFIIB domain-containing protein [Vicinamibacteria bacterium]|nr:zf-TFIIB domain-containing protein [Vicinamibacteria bacterium]
MIEDRRSEDDWFRENERHLLEAARVAREKREKARAEKEKAEELVRLKQLHYLKCPKCGHDMKEETLDRVTVDRCTYCEGVFFDAGELDQVLLKKGEERKGFFRQLIGF